MKRSTRMTLIISASLMGLGANATNFKPFCSSGNTQKSGELSTGRNGSMGGIPGAINTGTTGGSAGGGGAALGYGTTVGTGTGTGAGGTGTGVGTGVNTGSGGTVINVPGSNTGLPGNGSGSGVSVGTGIPGGPVLPPGAGGGNDVVRGGVIPESARTTTFKTEVANGTIPKSATTDFNRLNRYVKRHPNASCTSSSTGVTCVGANGKQKTFKNISTDVAGRYFPNSVSPDPTSAYLNYNSGLLPNLAVPNTAFVNTTNRGPASVSTTYDFSSSTAAGASK